MDSAASIDYEAVKRQTFGLSFTDQASDPRVATSILAGQLELKPHPAWTLPSELSWYEDPFDKSNWRAQLQTLRWLDPVRRVAATGDGAALDFWVRTARSWHDSNPANVSTSNYAWAPMVTGVRTLALTFASPIVPKSEVEWLTESIWEHGEWLADLRHIGYANLALSQHQALYIVGSAFHHTEWTDLARERLTSLFEASYDEQGVNVDGALGNHATNYLSWQSAFQRLRAEGANLPPSASRLELAVTELAHASRPDGTIERIGDTSNVSLHRIDSPEMTYLRSRGAAGDIPEELSKVYPAGFAFGRSGWGAYERDFDKETYYAISFGRGDRIHGHQDGGSITLHSNRHPWIVDAGKYTHAADPMTDYCRSRLGHNVIHVEGRTYNKHGIVELVNHRLADDLDDFAFLDLGYEGVELRRRIIYCRGGDFILVIDDVRSSEEVKVTQRWHLDANTTPNPIRNGFQLDRDGATATILWSGTPSELSVVAGETEPLDGWIATDRMEKIPASVLKASKSAAQLQFITLVGVPQSGSFTVDEVAFQDGTMHVAVTSGRGEFHLRITDESSFVSLGRQRPELQFLSREERLKMAMASVARLKMDSIQCPCVEPTFTPSHWAELRKWVWESEDVRQARLAALEQTLHMLKAAEDTSPDRGLRAAILDLAGVDIGPDLGVDAALLGINREPMISWPSARPVTSATSKLPTGTIRGVEELRIPEAGKAVFTAMVGGVLLPFLVGRGEGDVLSVRFHGAINRNKTTLPVFQGSGVDARGGGNFMIFQDPTLDLDKDMILSWYLGEGNTNLYEVMADYIRSVQSQVGATTVMLMGASGGGFAALQVASYLPESVALVFAPQTDIHAYLPQSRNEALQAAFGSNEIPNPNVLNRTSVVERYSNLAQPPRILYVQNVQDLHHVENHQRPFAAMLADSHPRHEDRVRFVEVQWGPGHVALTLERFDEHHATAMKMLNA
ncbi:heparinase II/III domain-containing protein [Arthrobacter flavus]|uniref:Heparinase II/III family protein n=1 Tax=Arthrobacter flavus TaxID=95172 RepID=A0ABW4Q8C4_9MICC